MSGGLLQFDIINTPTTDAILVRKSFSSIADNNFHHVTITYDGSSSATGVKFYFDGIQQTDLSILWNSLSSSVLNNQPLTLGALANGNNKMTGQLDDFQIFNRELSASEVSQLSNLNI